MPRPRFYRAGEAVREAILSSAAREYAHKGYVGASVNRIFQGAGLTKGAFYYYFDDKADLAAAVLERSVKEAMDLLRRLPAPKDAADFWRVLERSMRDSLEQMQRRPEDSEVLVRLGAAMARDRQLSERVTGLFGEAMAEVGALWERGRELGAVREDLPVPTLLALMQAIKEGLVRLLLPADGKATPEALERFVALQMDVFRRVAEARPTAPGPGKGARAPRKKRVSR